MVERLDRQSNHQDSDQVRLGLDQEERSFEQKVRQGEVVFSRQVTLGKDVKDMWRLEGRDPVGLLNTPFLFQARDLGDSYLYIASFPNSTAMQGEDIIRILREAKPPTHLPSHQGRGEITGDLVLLVPKERANNPEYQTLYDDHIASSDISHHFKEVEENHFPEFWNSIRAFAAGEIENSLDISFRELMDAKKAFAKYVWIS